MQLLKLKCEIARVSQFFKPFRIQKDLPHRPVSLLLKAKSVRARLSEPNSILGFGTPKFRSRK